MAQSKQWVIDCLTFYSVNSVNNSGEWSDFFNNWMHCCLHCINHFCLHCWMTQQLVVLFFHFLFEGSSLVYEGLVLYNVNDVFDSGGIKMSESFLIEWECQEFWTWTWPKSYFKFIQMNCLIQHLLLQFRHVQFIILFFHNFMQQLHVQLLISIFTISVA